MAMAIVLHHFHTRRMTSLWRHTECICTQSGVYFILTVFHNGTYEPCNFNNCGALSRFFPGYVHLKS